VAILVYNLSCYWKESDVSTSTWL